MKRRAAAAALVMLLVSMTLFSLGSQEETDHTITLVDGLNRSVQLSSTPERVVLAGRANLFITNAVYLFDTARDHVIALAETDQGMGDFFPVLDPRHHTKRRLPNSAGVEEIFSLKPDVVIMKDSMFSSLGVQLESLSVPVLTLGLESYDQYLRDIALLGTLFSQEHRAEELVQDMQSIVRRVSGAQEAEDKPRVLMLYYTSRDGTSTFHVPPADWIQTYMTRTAGGVPVWQEHHTGSGWQVVTFEQIAAWDPDMIFIISYTLPSREVAAMMKNSPLWSSLRAVQHHALLPFPGDFYSWAQSDIRWLLGLQWLAGQLHPELYPDQDMNQVTLDFFELYLSVSPEDTQAYILPLVQEDLSGRR